MAQTLNNNMTAPPESPSTSGQQASVTVLFADICGSTRLFEQYGDWRARQIESQVLELLAAKTTACAGLVVKTIGDEIMSRFAGAKEGVNAACDMQTALQEDPLLRELHIAIRIGLHHGSVLIEQDDLFGDAVNIAARIVSQAKADQIITTRETVELLPNGSTHPVRSLGRVRVRGKRDELEICEVLWQTETNNLTHVQLHGAERQEELRSLLLRQLHLEYREQRFEVAADVQIFRMGRGPANDLVVSQEVVSRSHADIEFRQGKFILVDHSTNGTYLLLDNGARFFVHREEFTLQHRGAFCLGKAVSDDYPDLIHYVCGHYL